MLLCDVGNTSYHFQEVDLSTNEVLNYKKSVDSFHPKDIKEKIYYICVNPKISKILESFDNWIDLASYIDMSPYYATMGIDRIVACEAVQNAVIVDAGSAITVDIVKDGKFMGGFIYPGTKAMNQTYTNISSALKYEFNYKINLDKLPKNSQDAISYGYLKLLHNEVMSHKIDITLTGGDAKNLFEIFPSAKLDNELIFNSMKKIVRRI